ncbi:MAG TPA: N-acetyl-gamma-glutamyl-phosphate reductase [Dehalococcoidales bacterium]|nr:MAG: N-acetyl-gamma-glutamyl-phosphate reductase [Chloroflexi bacterium RBG_16_60_22]HJX13149.1 N-acetyl-gamma-glutamyl-phosphate reductase [Dehalococcoidales bacterium]
MARTRVGIINVTGYAGVELARLLGRHPGVELASVTGRSAAGQALGDVFPHLAGIGLTITADPGKVDLALVAMPHKESTAAIIPLLEKGVRVVDVSADFRLNNPDDYPKWYGFTHPTPHLLAEAVYGIPELYREAIKKARLVASTGCYAVAGILALAPAVKAGIIGPDIIIDSKSGVSGAGRSLSLTTHYSEVNEDVSAYGLGGHRHLPEIVQELTKLRPVPAPVITFVPHLIPMTRGILTTAYAPLTDGKKGQEELLTLYRDFYRESPFVRVVTAPPHTKHTWGSNYCHIHPTLDPRTGRLIVISVIDNLVKGAAGQAVQNMNLMLGLPETAGLEAAAIYP